jgi:DNA-binding CsgD family transcriptional regulator
MSQLEDSLNDIDAMASPEDVLEILKHIQGRYGLKTAAYLATGLTDGASPGDEPFHASTYSAEWIERYRTEQYLKIDPAIQMGFRQLLPVHWDQLSSRDPKASQFFGEAVEMGAGRQGVSLPVHGPYGDRALLSATMDAPDTEWAECRRMLLRDLPIIAAHLHQAVLCATATRIVRPRLAPRETECLYWISEGKTVWECAMILGLSVHTVRDYLECAREKLNATSNTHAVAILLRANLL